MSVFSGLIKYIARLLIPSIVEESKYQIRQLIVKELDYATRRLSILEKDFRAKIGYITSENADLLRIEYDRIQENFADRFKFLAENVESLEENFHEKLGGITAENILLLKQQHKELEEGFLERLKSISSLNVAATKDALEQINKSVDKNRTSDFIKRLTK